ncbi:MAG: methyltransferase [Planctomycetes bacterium]|nr:methyltransferase [Planctomycetota bacterium]
MRKTKKRAKTFPELLEAVATKLRPPFGILLGSPGEVAELLPALPEGDVACYQMDLYQADRLREHLGDQAGRATIEMHADLWDTPLPSPAGRGEEGEGEASDVLDLPPHPRPLSQGERGGFQTLIYPVPHGGERALKLDMLEQAFHVIRPNGALIVLSPYEKEDFFQGALKKVFGKVHAPMDGDGKVLWALRTGERRRRRHEMTYHVRVDEQTSYCFVSRPGVFGYGFYDEGARALMEATELTEGQRVLDLGCGVGTNGILAARRIGPTGSVVFADSNVRAIALAELNARAIGVPNFETLVSHTLTELAPASFDAVLANPPYYAQGAIIRLFIERSQMLLRPGGTLYLVTKRVDTTWPTIQEFFPEPEMYENRGYVIFRSTKT